MADKQKSVCAVITALAIMKAERFCRQWKKEDFPRVGLAGRGGGGPGRYFCVAQVKN
jgi:hypothetical protein